jgi:hypothetical protein
MSNKFNYRPQKRSFYYRFKRKFYTQTGNNGIIGPGYRTYYSFDYGKLSLFLGIIMFVCVILLIIFLNGKN